MVECIKKGEAQLPAAETSVYGRNKLSTKADKDKKQEDDDEPI